MSQNVMNPQIMALVAMLQEHPELCASALAKASAVHQEVSDPNGSKVEMESKGKDKVLEGSVSGSPGQERGGSEVSSEATSSSGDSWADAVEEELAAEVAGSGVSSAAGGSVESTASDSGADSGVEWKVKKPVGGSASSVNFLAETAEIGGLFAIVKASNASKLYKWLGTGTSSAFKRHRVDFALATYTMATIPGEFKDGQKRFRMLGLLGDKVMSTVLVGQFFLEGQDVQTTTTRVGAVLSRKGLIGVCNRSGLANMLVYSSGVDRNIAVTSGEAVEVVAGVVFRAFGLPGVEAYMRKLQLLK